MASSASDWISLAEAAEILASSNVRFRPATIGGWARDGKLQSIKLGGRRYFRRGEVRALVAGPRRVRASELQPGLFEELGG
ncbi:MAG TPA: helix-turn-helix domain-containing protein [Candidatus Binatus sp.]|nr:helix-turn-helix domain-containing protein [Candidatus Binatus sp.]